MKGRIQEQDGIARITGFPDALALLPSRMVTDTDPPSPRSRASGSGGVNHMGKGRAPARPRVV